NSNETINATNPLYIGGAVDSWVTDLVWDRIMRIGPDGMPRPWAADSVNWVDDKTVEIKLRAGMKWHDGKPVTIDDVIFSFEAPAEEVVLERFCDHFQAPKVERWIMRIVPNAEATLGMLKRGELNFLGMFGGDADVLTKFAKDNPDIATRTEVDIGFEYVAFNNRRPPFDDVAFRRALSLAIDRRLMVSAAWQDYAIPANSHVSPVLTFWHDPAVDQMKTGLAEAKKTLQDAGYRVVGGKLYYPAGK